MVKHINQVTNGDAEHVKANWKHQ